MIDMPKCPTCSSEYTYEDGDMFICPECAHEWAQAPAESAEAISVVRDAFGAELKDGVRLQSLKT